MSVEDDAEAWILRALFGGLALCALVAVVAFAICAILKVRNAMMDDDDRLSCRRGGGDVILIARDAFNGNEAFLALCQVGVVRAVRWISRRVTVTSSPSLTVRRPAAVQRSCADRRGA